MSTGIIDVIKQVAINAAEANSPVKILYGVVMTANPIKVKIGEELILEEEFLTVNGTVNDNEDVIVIRQQGGQKYIVLGTTTDTLVYNVYMGGYDADWDGTLSYRFPIKGTYRITSSYGDRIHPISGTKKFHSGVDIAGASNKQIYAVANGTVVSAIKGYNGGWGNEIRIKHDDGAVSQYAHLRDIYVKKDQRVTPAMVIGYMGTTGSSTGVHLHLGIKNFGANPFGSSNWTTPLRFLRDRGVRC